MSTVAATADDAQVQAWPALEDTVATSIAATLATPEAWERDPDSLRQAIDQGIRRGIEIAVQAAADRWSEDVLGAPRYARTTSRVGYRGGLREHTVHFGFVQNLGPGDLHHHGVTEFAGRGDCFVSGPG